MFINKDRRHKNRGLQDELERTTGTFAASGLDLFQSESVRGAANRPVHERGRDQEEVPQVVHLRASGQESGRPRASSDRVRGRQPCSQDARGRERAQEVSRGRRRGSAQSRRDGESSLRSLHHKLFNYIAIELFKCEEKRKKARKELIQKQKNNKSLNDLGANEPITVKIDEDDPDKVSINEHFLICL